MAKQWQQGLSYRAALDALEQRFQNLRTQDRVVNHELMPCIESIDGFLFAVNAAPGEVKPSLWLGDLLTLIQQPDEVPGASINLLISYAQQCKKRQAAQKYPLPAVRDALAALVPASPLNAFCHGFELGYQCVADLWSAKLPAELAAELESQVMALRFFASTDHARQMIQQHNLSMRPDQLADEVLKNFSKAADLHVRLGMALAVDQENTH